MDVGGFANTIVEGIKTLYEAQGINEVLKQNYGVCFSVGYVFYLLGSIKKKTIMPGKEAEDSALILKCKKEFGGE